MTTIRFGPARVPSQASPEEAVALLVERGYTACELDFERKFWLDAAFAARLGELAREAGVALSLHAPLAAFMGHAERGKKLNMATGMLDHSAGIAAAGGALAAAPRLLAAARADDDKLTPYDVITTYNNYY